MKAREMFEKLNGNYVENKNRITIEFYDKYTDNYVYVEFWKDKNKEFCFDINNFRKPELDLKLLLQAINKQVEELGWNER